MKEVNKVYQSKEYSEFSQLSGNRTLNKANLKKLVESMKEELLQIPIIVNENLQIIDGQHRFEACKELDLPIYFIIVNGYKLKHIHKLNTISRKWNFADYLDGYADLGIQDYITVRSFVNRYRFGGNECLTLLAGYRNSIGADERQKFYEGNFKVKSLHEAEQKANAIESIKPFYAGYKRQSFVIAMLKVLSVKEFDIDVFIQKLSFQSTKLVDCTTYNEYIKLIEGIYNYKSRSKKIRLI